MVHRDWRGQTLRLIAVPNTTLKPLAGPVTDQNGKIHFVTILKARDFQAPVMSWGWRAIHAKHDAASSGYDLQPQAGLPSRRRRAFQVFATPQTALQLWRDRPPPLFWNGPPLPRRVKLEHLFFCCRRFHPCLTFGLFKRLLHFSSAPGHQSGG